jgi:hypothetical protein
MPVNRSVFGIYLTRTDVESAVNALKDAGFAKSDVSVLLPENIQTGEMTTDRTTKAPEGAAVGVGGQRRP